MVQKKALAKKMLASILVFCICFAHMSTFAAFFTDIGVNDNNQKIENAIEMSAYVQTNELERVDAYTAKADEEGLFLDVLIKIKEGYVKSPVITITNLDKEVFEIDQTRIDSEYIQSVSNNQFIISRLNEGTDNLIRFPIKFKESAYYDVNKTGSNVEFVLSGTYVDLDANHFEFEKHATALLSWDLDAAIIATSSVEKSFEYTNDKMKYMLVQYAIDVGLKDTIKVFPMQNTSINFKVPQNDALIPQIVTVDAISTAFTNGKSGETVIFDDTNWVYDNGNVSINVSNMLEPENLMYPTPQGKDRYTINVIYAVAGKVDNKLATTISVNTNMYNSGAQKQLELNGDLEYDITDAKGSLVSFQADSIDEEISKGNIYANYNLNSDYYETIYSKLLSLNISKADFVKQILLTEKNEYFENEQGEKYSAVSEKNSNTYYKSTTINKENLSTILGDTGTLDILDSKGNVLVTLNKDTAQDENGNVEITYNTRIPKIAIRVNNPANEGILNIVNVKAIARPTYEKRQLITFKKIVNTYDAEAIYTGNIKDEIETKSNEVNLNDTITSATIMTGRKVLSTLTDNKNIELKIALNNYNEKTDLYKNPVFEIIFPKEIEQVTVNSMSLLYGNNELKISNVEGHKNKNGNVVLKVNLDGLQTKYSLVSLTEGTNILLNIDVKVNEFTTSKNSKIEMNYYNENATNYASASTWNMESSKPSGMILSSNGIAETEVSFQSAIGVVTAQRLSGYNENNSVYSYMQGKKSDRVLTESEAKIVTDQIIIMNNTQDTMKNVSVLGRTSFENNKTILTNENLGTNINTKMLEGLSQTLGNAKNVEIYYSENENANKNLEDSTNGWTLGFSNKMNIKSYLIVYKEDLNPEEMTVFTYKYVIPENLKCDTDIYSTIATYYTDSQNKELAIEADRVGLETVSAPKITVNIRSNAGESVAAGDIIEYTVNVRNIGEVDAEGINVTLDIPKESTYLEYINPTGNEEGRYEKREDIKQLNIDVGTLLVGEDKDYKYNVVVNDKAKTLSSATVEADAEGLSEEKAPESTENPEEPADPEESESEEDVKDETPSTEIKQSDLEVDFTENYADLIVPEQAVLEYYIKLHNNTSNSKGITKVIHADGREQSYEEYVEEKIKEEKEKAEEENDHEGEHKDTYDDSVKFIYGETLKNLKFEQHIPEGVTFEKATIPVFNEQRQDYDHKEVGNYDEATRTLSFDFGDLNVDENATMTVYVKTNYIEEIKKSIGSYIVTKGDNVEEKTSYKIMNIIGRPNLETTFVSSASGKTVKGQEQIKYNLTIKNSGIVKMFNLKLVDMLPEELKGLSGSYYFDNDTKKKTNVAFLDSRQMTTTVNLDVNQTLHMEINTKVQDVKEEKKIDNKVSLESDNLKEPSETDKVSTTIQKSEENDDDSSDRNNSNKDQVTIVENNEETSNNNNQNKGQGTYKITGRAWLDSNRNGKQDKGELGIGDISVKLYNANSNTIVQTASTDNSGNYVFSKVTRDKYYIIFGYNNQKYALTDYKKENVDDSLNSDVLLTNSLAITDIINVTGGNVANIDIGLMDAQVFDLSLEKNVKKVTVQTGDKVVAYDYDNTNFAKLDIKAKELKDAKVYMEYSIIVSNRGEISGTVGKVVDYIPKDTIFSPDLNPGWYQTEDGSIVTDGFKDIVLNPGEAKSIKLVLVKQMTTENTGIVSNTAEILEHYNDSAIEDIDSTPGNRKDGEDDYATADVVISVNTGGSVINVALAALIALIALVTVYLIKKNVLDKMRRW